MKDMLTRWRFDWKVKARSLTLPTRTFRTRLEKVEIEGEEENGKEFGNSMLIISLCGKWFVFLLLVKPKTPFPTHSTLLTIDYTFPKNFLLPLPEISYSSCTSIPNKIGFLEHAHECSSSSLQRSVTQSRSQLI